MIDKIESSNVVISVDINICLLICDRYLKQVILITYIQNHQIKHFWQKGFPLHTTNIFNFHEKMTIVWNH